MNTVQITIAVIVMIFLGFFSWKKPRLSSIIIWSTVASVLLITSALLIIPGPFLNKALWLALSFPITWCALQYWCYWADKQWQVLSSLLAVSAISGFIIFRLAPIVVTP